LPVTVRCSSGSSPEAEEPIELTCGLTLTAILGSAVLGADEDYEPALSRMSDAGALRGCVDLGAYTLLRCRLGAAAQQPRERSG
jgi:hypothetical protein